MQHHIGVDDVGRLKRVPIYELVDVIALCVRLDDAWCANVKAVLARGADARAHEGWIRADVIEHA